MNQFSRIVPRVARRFATTQKRCHSALSRSQVSSSRLAASCHLFHVTQRGFAEAKIVVPNLGDSITEGVLSSWMKQEGDFVEEDEIIGVIETDKVAVDIRAPEAGLVKSLLVEEDAEVLVGADLFVIDTSAERPAGSPAKDTSTTSAPTPTQSSAAPSTPPPAATPTPTPPKAAPKATPPPQPTQPPIVAGGSRTERREKMSRMRQTIAKNMKTAQNTSASLTTFQEIDCSNIIQMRTKYKDMFLKKHDVKLGFMSAFVKATSAALQDKPIVNAYISEDGKEIVYRDFVDISVAVASPTGLVVPVLRNVESMNFADVEKTIAHFGQKAKNGQMALEDMAGGTFTISNGGVFGSLMGTPILNYPQSAILGMHGIFDRPVAINGSVEIRPMMYACLTYDHRIIDGREAALFLRKIKAGVEDPRTILLDVGP